MKKIFIGILTIFSATVFTGCPHEDFGDRFWIHNISDKDVFCYVAITSNPYRDCDDTFLPAEKLGDILKKDEITSRSFDMESVCNIIRIFILDPDTIAKYPWETIRKNNKILKRYDIQKNELQKMDWKITYP